MVDDANVTNAVPEPPTSTPDADEVRTETETVAGAPTPQPRAWTMPKSPVTREQADEVGRIARKAVTAIMGFIAGLARYVARTVRQLALAIDAVPPAVRVLALMGIFTLLGIVGAIALEGTVALVCIVVVIPLCSTSLGVLGHRWYSGLGTQSVPRAAVPAAPAPVADLQRSIEYVDKKLTLALNAFGAERQQHAMIALFQAKTAVELTLGTEQDTAFDALLAVDDHDARPRIRAGSASKSLRENTSLAAS
ncbi:hypothetical protein A5792_20015 [Mycolicibacterium peregrinum]|uniref:Uncharacterized protein n=1 Tax=Mycolicibacterium peregrinum TaxID=43304 RepID=A0A1A0R675_MYCPR|nr:hypothetical protein A5792_20015 [Mycolicibacterium peregrinum]